MHLDPGLSSFSHIELLLVQLIERTTLVLMMTQEITKIEMSNRDMMWCNEKIKDFLELHHNDRLNKSLVTKSAI